MNDWATIILGIHVLGACIWVGGMVSDFFVRRALRRAVRGDELQYTLLTGHIGRVPGRVLWSALFITVLTGVYNLTWYVPGGLWNVLSYLPQAPWLVAKLAIVGVVLTVSGFYILLLRLHRGREEDSGVPPGQAQRLRRDKQLLTYTATMASVVTVLVAVFL